MSGVFLAAAPRGGGPRLRLNSLLLALVLAVLLPSLAVGCFTTWRAVRSGQAADEARLRDTATALSLAVDREIGSYRSAATALAASRSLDPGTTDLAGFETEARRVAQSLGTWLVLMDGASMRQIVNTALPAGTAPAAEGNADFKAVAATGRPLVTNLFVGPTTGRLGIGVAVPVHRAGRVAYVLAVRLTPERLRELLVAQDVRAGSFASITDAQGRIVARSDALHDKLVGQVPSAEVRAQYESRPAGLFQARTLDGVERVVAFQSVPVTDGWRVFVAEPAAELADAWQRPVLALASGGVVLLFAAGIVAFLTTRVLLRPVQALSRHAAAQAAGMAHTSAAALAPAVVQELEALRRGFEQAEAATEARSRALRESEARLRLALDAAALGTWRWEVARGTRLEWDERCKALFGFAADAQVDYAAWAALLADDDRVAAEGAVARALDPADPGDDLACDYRVRRRDGSLRWLSVRGRAFFEPDAGAAGRRAVRILGTIQDVTEARQSQAALAQLTATLDLATVFVRDFDGTIRHWSRGCERLYGWTAEEALGRNAHALLRTVFPLPLPELQAVLEREGEWSGDLRHTTRDGRELIVATRKALRRDGEGRPCAVAEAATDVTAERAAEAALERSHEEARIDAERVQLALAAGAIIGTWLWDLTCDAFTVDERFAYSFGIDPALGRTGLSLEQVIATVHPEDLEGLRAAIAEVIERGGAYSHEYRVRDRAGVYRWIEANGRVELAEDGTPLRFPGVLIDIESRRTLEAERDRALELLRAFADAVPGVVYAKDTAGRVLVANRGVSQAVGKPLQAILGKTELEYLDDRQQAMRLMANDRLVMDSGKAQQVEETVSRSDGTSAVWLSTKAPFRDSQGRVIGIIGSSVDITERKAAEGVLAEINNSLEEQVRQRTAELRGILDSAGTAIVVTDSHCRITLFNRAAQALSGHTEAQALGCSATGLLFDAQDLRARKQALEEHFGRPLSALELFMARAHGDDGGEWPLRRRDGQRVPVLLQVRTLCSEGGHTLGTVYAITDLSERKALEETLRQRTHQAEAASRAKSTFLAHMSHELRTPLNAVIGLSQLLQQRALPDDMGRFVGHIHAAGEQLLALVSDVLDLSRIEAGEMSLETVAFEPRPLLETALALVRPQADVKSLDLATDFAADLPPCLVGDPLRLRQVLLNLLGNAVKFTPAGSVTLRVRLVRHERLRAMFRFEVEDTGIGIAPEVQQRIFDPFTQADDSTTRRFGGSGLGLSIVRRLVAMMGGELALRSTPGAGSTFSVTIGFELPAAQAAH